MVETLAALIGPLQQFYRAVDGSPFLIPCDQEADGAGEIRCFVEIREGGRHHAGDAAFHVDGAAAVELPVLDDAAERVVLPMLRIARRHHVSVAREEKIWPADAEA